MKRNFILVIIIIICVMCSIRFISLKNFYNKIQIKNNEIQTQLEKINQKSIFLYERQLYHNSLKTIFENIDKKNKIPVEYDYANFDIDLVPIIISDNIIIIQSHLIKILHNNLVYEYKCNEFIKAITYPRLVNSDLVFYLIKFNSNKMTSRVSSDEREWVLQKIVFSEGEFIENNYECIKIPDSYIIEPLNSEVSYFTYENDIINIVLTDNFKKSSIFQISDNKDEIKCKYDGKIIIPNKFCNKDFYYIRTDEKDQTWLMKDDEIVSEINNKVSQGYFINENVIQFIYYDSSEIGMFDFINGPHIPIYYSDLYLVNEDKKISSSYTYYEKSLFADKDINDNILVIY